MTFNIFLRILFQISCLMRIFLLFSFWQDVSQYRSSIPLAPRHSANEDEESNTTLGTGAEGEEEVESDTALPPPSSEVRSKRNQDRDSAREEPTRSQKRPLTLSGGEGSSKLPALSMGHGKVAPIRSKKVLTTLAGRRVNPSEGDVSASKPRTSAPTRAKPSVAPPPTCFKNCSYVNFLLSILN